MLIKISWIINKRVGGWRQLLNENLFLVISSTWNLESRGRDINLSNYHKFLTNPANVHRAVKRGHRRREAAGISSSILLRGRKNQNNNKTTSNFSLLHSRKHYKHFCCLFSLYWLKICFHCHDFYCFLIIKFIIKSTSILRGKRFSASLI